MSSEDHSTASIFEQQAAPSSRGTRIDRFLAEWLEPKGLSRSRLAALVEAGQVTVDGQTVRPSFKLRGGEQICLTLPPPPAAELRPTNIPLDILYEDPDILVLVKPAGLVVHPAKGSEEGTLVHGLLYHVDELSGVNGDERPGIVHRLDKDTSGVLVVAKSDAAHRGLVEQFQVHSITRRYRALVRGVLPEPRGTWESQLGRNPNNRLRMASVREGGKRAVTHYETLQVFPGASLLELTLETGRTHQIRVHCSEAGFPVLNDDLYGQNSRRGLPNDPVLKAALDAGNRQQLHARELGFVHPTNGQFMHFVAEPPADFQRIVLELRRLDVELRGASDKRAGR